MLTSPPRRARRTTALWAAAATVLGGMLALAGTATAAATHDVSGAFDTAYGSVGGMRVKGWAIDPDERTAAVTIYASVDGKHWSSASVANQDRPDVGRAHPVAGPYHGFSWIVPTPQGRHTVCLVAGNLGPGRNVSLGCRTHDMQYGPFGVWDTATATEGALHVAGWAMDSDDLQTALTATITVDGIAHTVPADVERPDIAQVRAGAGTRHGYDVTYPVAQGAHQVCVDVTNIGYGENTGFGCRTVTLADGPVAAYQVLAQQGDDLRLRGWAYDNDSRRATSTVLVQTDGGPVQVVAADAWRPDVARAHPVAGPHHGFDVLLPVAPGAHTVCVTARNTGFGANLSLGCRTATLSYTPSATLTTLSSTPLGSTTVTGWVADPETASPISARVTVDGSTVATTLASAHGTGPANGHSFSTTFGLRSGSHTVCVVGLNVARGTADSPPSCRSLTLALSPVGRFGFLLRRAGGTDLEVIGYALDPDTSSPLSVGVTLDGVADGTVPADVGRPDVAASYPGLGAAHGIDATVAADDGEHTVCLTARNVGGGQDTPLGCRLIDAVHPVPPSAPQSVGAVAGYGGATITWTPPASDGGAPVSGYYIRISPGFRRTIVASTARSVTVNGLAANRPYLFVVRALNVAGSSAALGSPTVRTQVAPPPQRTPAPVSTSRYIRNVVGSSSRERATMRAEGATDARANPSGHGYLVLLDIGGQKESYGGGVVLSGGIRFVSYTDLVNDVNAYLVGYHSQQRPSAPVTVAIGTNNDLDVTTSSGRSWAVHMVDPIAAFAQRFNGISIAGADDIEPGFRADYTQTRNWLSGYLSATSAPFVFNGSADGCAWTVTGRRCNNGWTMAELYHLAGGASPVRIANLPQVYNTTMADQWKYISLTGVVGGSPRIDFAGTLTEHTACAQAGSCGSMSGVSAWSRLWSDLQSDRRLAVASLPYATDLRIDR